MSPNNTPMERARRATQAATRRQGNEQVRLTRERIQRQRANINKRLNELNEHYNDLKFSTGPFRADPPRTWGINNFRKLNNNAAKLHSELRSTNLIRISNERKAKLANIRRYAKNQLEGWESNNNSNNNNNARANSNSNSNSNNTRSTRPNLNIMAQELGNRLSNLQRRQTNLSRTPGDGRAPPHPSHWNALGQDAESLYDFIRNHNLTSRAREQGVQSAIAAIISDAIAYSNNYYNRNSGSNNNNRNNSNSGSNNNSNNNNARANNNMGTRANLARRVATIQRNYNRLLSNRPDSPAQWNALGNQSRATIQYIRRHAHTNYAQRAGFTRTLRQMIARSNAHNPNARANNNNSGSNNNATNRRTGGVVARARAGRERVAAEVNHMRTVNTRLSNLQRRQTNLSRLPMGPPGRWNALGQDAESLYDFIRNHNLTSRAREQGVQSAIAAIISDAIAYSNNYYNRNSGSNNNNRNNSNSGSNNNSNNNNARANNNMGTRANLARRVATIQRNYNRLLSNRPDSPAQWNALGNQSRATIQYIRRHAHTNYAQRAGFTRTLRQMIARSNAHNPNARANNNNSGSNNNATNRRTGGVVARARAGRERVAAEVNHMRTVNTRLANLQRRQTNLSLLPMGPPGRWNALGQDARNLDQYIRTHGLVGTVRGPRWNRLQLISDTANSYRARALASRANNSNTPARANSNSNSNNNNNNNNYNNNTRARMANEYNRMVAGNIGHILNTKANNFKKNTKWGVRARNNAGAWYNTINKKLRRINTNVISNFIGGNVYKPSQLNTLYFDANAKGNGGRKLYTKNTIVRAGGINPATSTLMVPRLLPNNVKTAINQFMRRRGINATKQAKKILPANATKNAIKKKAVNIYNNV